MGAMEPDDSPDGKHEPTALTPLPGLDVVGRGVYLRPHSPHEFKRRHFAQADFEPVYFREAGRSYALPRGFVTNESPPLPRGAALNQVRIEESWERFSRSRALDYGLAAGWMTFNVDASSHLGNELRSDHESYYGSRSSFVALWSVYLEDPSQPTHALPVDDLPAPYSPAHRRAYEAFFDRYGTHFVKRAWVGGKAEVLFCVAKSGKMSREDIYAGLRASFILPNSPSPKVGRELSRSQEALMSRAQCTVVGRGGDELALASLSSLDGGTYDAWLKTIKDNPQTVELGLAGIWTLVVDEVKSQALHDAYAAAATFSPVSSVFAAGDVLHFTRGRTTFCFDLDARLGTRPQPLGERWPALEALGIERVDATFFDVDGQLGAAGELCVFALDQLVRLDLETGAVREGDPVPLREVWPGLPFEQIDAVLSAGPDALYLFSGGRYLRLELATGAVSEGYPDLIQRRWRGVTFDRIDAAMRWEDGKYYFFRGDQFIRYDPVTLRAEPGFPKAIVGSYVEDWSFFE